MRRLTQEEFIDRVKKIHGEDTFDFSKTIYICYIKPISLICKKHGIISILPKNLLRGCGCKFCQTEKRTSNEEFIQKSNLIYSEDLFDYSLVKYKLASNHVIIKCKKCQKTFKRTPNTHLSGKLYCPHCSNRAKLTTEEFIKRSIETHDDRYGYEKSIYINSRTLITVTCKFHGDFTTHPYLFMKGSNCPTCNCSKGELKIKKFLEINNVHFIKECKFDDCINPKTNWKLPFDFYLPDLNQACEFDGTHHFEERFYYNSNLKDIQYKDSLKTKYCEDNNIKLIRIPYWDFKNIEEILTRELNL